MPVLFRALVSTYTESVQWQLTHHVFSTGDYHLQLHGFLDSHTMMHLLLCGLGPIHSQAMWSSVLQNVYFVKDLLFGPWLALHDYRHRFLMLQVHSSASYAWSICRLDDNKSVCKFCSLPQLLAQHPYRRISMQQPEPVPALTFCGVDSISGANMELWPGLAQNRHRGLTAQLAYCCTVDHLCQAFAEKGSCLFHQPQFLQTCIRIRGATSNLCFSCHGSEQDDLSADMHLLAHVLLQSLADPSVYTVRV